MYLDSSKKVFQNVLHCNLLKWQHTGGDSSTKTSSGGMSVYSKHPLIRNRDLVETRVSVSYAKVVS